MIECELCGAIYGNDEGIWKGCNKGICHCGGKLTEIDDEGVPK